MALLDSLTLLTDDELPAALGLGNVMEAHGFLRPAAAREVRKEILRRLTASAARGDRGPAEWLAAVEAAEDDPRRGRPADFQKKVQRRGEELPI